MNRLLTQGSKGISYPLLFNLLPFLTVSISQVGSGKDDEFGSILTPGDTQCTDGRA